MLSKIPLENPEKCLLNLPISKAYTYHMYNIYWVIKYVNEHIKISARES